jgi:hypothetical protein
MRNVRFPPIARIALRWHTSPMGTRYVEPQSSRFIQERIDGVEQVRIPIRRNWFILLFMGFWICGWTVGGIVTIDQVSQNFDWFPIFWLGGWALGWIFAAATICSQIAGSEIIRVVGRDLETGVGVGKLRWRRLYRGDHIRNLRSSDPNPMGWPFRFQQTNPFRPRAGAVKFDYGSQTVFAASSAEEAEGRMIADWLSARLPSTATSES